MPSRQVKFLTLVNSNDLFHKFQYNKRKKKEKIKNLKLKLNLFLDYAFLNIHFSCNCFNLNFTSVCKLNEYNKDANAD